MLDYEHSRLATNDWPRVGYDLRLLESFLVLAEERHFGRAAERLAFAQPALSQQIQRLETQLGVSLFARTARSVQLTIAGAAFRERAQVSLASAINAGEAARSAAHGVSGSLALAVSPTALLVVPGLFHEFSKSCGNVRLAISLSSDAGCLAALGQGSVDAAIVWSTGPPPPRFAQSSTPVSDGRLGLRLHRSHRPASLPRVPFAQLRDERLIMFPRDPAPEVYDGLKSPISISGFIAHS